MNTTQEPPAQPSSTPHTPYVAQPPFRNPGEPPQRRSRLPSTAETLGWGGGVLTVVGVVAVTWDFWSSISGWALVGLLAAATAVLAVAAFVVGELTSPEDPDSLAENLSVALWWMSGIAGTITTYVAIAELSDGRTFLALLAASLAATGMFGAYHVRTGKDHALAGAILSMNLAVFSVTSLASAAPETRAFWLVMAGPVIAVALALAAEDRTRISYGAVLVLLFGSSQAVVGFDPGAALILATMAALLVVAATAIVGRRPGEKVVASLLATLVTAEVAYDLAPEIFTLSTVILLVGIGMTSGCIWLVRRSRKQAT
ncbi:hypothetical protein [Euzebya tangerina]|uniref:hypothetical protein n=1 Tax=Euzebya tangerina TaxID=591198 RepID=UPI000E311696|nr:hypothetical protein [Euzebya tangerina]